MDYKKLVRNHEHQLLVNKWKEEQKIDYVQEFTLVKGIENNNIKYSLLIILIKIFFIFYILLLLNIFSKSSFML